jgi:hypothetical protein
MSRCALLFIAVACVIASVNAQAYVQTQFWSENGCTGTSFTSNATTGLCTVQGTGSYITYCDTDFVYTFNYVNDLNCTDANLDSASKVPTGCNKALGAKYAYVCVNPGTPAPASFPPAGFYTVQSYYNTTSGGHAKVCSGSDIISGTQQAGRIGVCKARSGTGKTAGYEGQYANTDAGIAGDAIFTGTGSNTCSGTITRARVAPIRSDCDDGSIASIPSDAPGFPSDLPNIGIQSYDSEDKTCAGQLKGIELFTAACVDNTQFACGTGNSSQAIGTYTRFSGDAGACTTQFSQLVQDDGVCVDSKIFTCNYSPSPSSASTAATSAVMMLAAAFAAVFVTRSL